MIDIDPDIEMKENISFKKSSFGEIPGYNVIINTETKDSTIKHLKEFVPYLSMLEKFHEDIRLHIWKYHILPIRKLLNNIE